MKPYVLVRHKSTGRTFSLNRGYTLLNPDLGNLNPPEKFVEEWDGWMCLSRPSWTEGMDDSEFHAYWLY